MKSRLAAGVIVMSSFFVSANSMAQTSQTQNNIEPRFGPIGAVVGGIGGAVSYGLNVGIGGSRFSPSQLAMMVGGGVVAGGLAGPAALIWRFNSGIVGGSVSGLIERYKI